MTETKQLAALVDEVVKLRGEKQLLDDRYNTCLAHWEQENTVLLDRRNLAKAALIASEEQLRQEAVAVFNSTGERKPVTGVEVKMTTRLEYPANKALEWAISKKVCLLLDSKTFEKLPEGVRPDFVVEHEEPKAYISKNLEAE